MKDRFGNKIIIGWPDHQILWIEAAMTLPQKEKVEAFQEIADLTGRDYASVYRKSVLIRQDREAAQRRARLAAKSLAHQTARMAVSA